MVLVLLPIVPWMLSCNEVFWRIFAIDDKCFCQYTDCDGGISALSYSQCSFVVCVVPRFCSFVLYRVTPCYSTLCCCIVLSCALLCWV